MAIIACYKDVLIYYLRYIRHERGTHITLGKLKETSCKNYNNMIENEEYHKNPRYNISYYGADYPVDSLVLRMKEEEIIIPHFQREYVWNHNEASRFIESLLLRLPVPSIFLLRDKHSNKLVIIDGQQRLKTLLYFFEGYFPDHKKFDLRNVLPQYERLTYENLPFSEQRELKNSIIHSIIIMDEENSDAPYHLFERLNTSGTPLTSQEIRSAIFFGQFNDLLIELSHLPDWNKVIAKKDKRLTDQEYILRLIAMNFDFEFYNGDMKSFLNQFMLKNREMQNFSATEVKEMFISTISKMKECFPIHKKPFSIAFFEPIFYWASKEKSLNNIDNLKRLVDRLNEETDYLALTKSSTTSKSSVFHRFDLVKQLITD